MTQDTAATLIRVLGLQIDALIQEYGPAPVLLAVAETIALAGIRATGAHRYRDAGTLSITAAQLRDAATILHEPRARY